MAKSGGSFKKGQSGNPNGRPPACPPEVKALAQQHTETALKTLVSIVKDKKAQAGARVTAASTILDRGWGKPTQHHDVNMDITDRLAALLEARRKRANG